MLGSWAKSIVGFLVEKGTVLVHLHLHEGTAIAETELIHEPWHGRPNPKKGGESAPIPILVPTWDPKGQLSW